MEEAFEDADKRVDGENQIGDLLWLIDHHSRMQIDADKTADDNQIRVFDEGEHRQYGNENTEKADGVVQKLITGANGFENGIGDKPCGDAGDGCPNALFRGHATEDR